MASINFREEYMLIDSKPVLGLNSMEKSSQKTMGLLLRRSWCLTFPILFLLMIVPNVDRLSTIFSEQILRVAVFILFLLWHLNDSFLDRLVLKFRNDNFPGRTILVCGGGGFGRLLIFEHRAGRAHV